MRRQQQQAAAQFEQDARAMWNRTIGAARQIATAASRRHIAQDAKIDKLTYRGRFFPRSEVEYQILGWHLSKGQDQGDSVESDERVYHTFPSRYGLVLTLGGNIYNYTTYTKTRDSDAIVIDPESKTAWSNELHGSSETEYGGDGLFLISDSDEDWRRYRQRFGFGSGIFRDEYLRLEKNVLTSYLAEFVLKHSLIPSEK